MVNYRRGNPGVLVSWDEDFFFFAAFAALGILRGVKFQTISRSIVN
jgi:hypothetical protein